MAGLLTNANYINNTIKPAIKSAIEAQGVTVPSTDSFLDYADRIAEIEGGGSGYQLKDLPTGSISTVNDAAELPLNALKVSVEAWQEGSGDPSPSNIRPIHGWDSGEITVCDDVENPTQTETITQQFPQTIYGAEWDVVGGQLKVTDGYIASYNGESLPSTWISDRDVYASGTTPTTGAEVVYKLATPTIIDLSPLSIRLLEGTNNLYVDCGEVLEGEYFVDEGAIDVRKVDYTIGSNAQPMIADGRYLSGFASMSGYGAFPRDGSGNWLDVDWSDDFEIGARFKVSAFPSSGNMTIFGSGIQNSMVYAPDVYFWNGSTAYITLSTDGSTSAVDTALNYTFQADTWYFVRLKFTLSTLNLKIEVSTDMENFTTAYNGTLASVPYHNSASICIGGMAQSSNYASNSIQIDTFNTYIKDNSGSIVWGAFGGA